MLQGAPIRVEWAGWTSDTYTLSRCGWSIATREADYDDALYLMLHHKGLEVTGMGRVPNYRHVLMSHLHDGYRGGSALDGLVVPLQTVNFTKNIAIESRHPITSARWVDGNQYVMKIEDRMPLRDLTLFRQLDMPAPQELVTDPETVQEMLDKILAMQAPVRQEIRARDARRERDALVPRRIHAQIVSLAA